MIVQPDAVYLARSPINRADAPFATYRGVGLSHPRRP